MLRHVLVVKILNRFANILETRVNRTNLARLREIAGGGIWDRFLRMSVKVVSIRNL